MGPSRGLFAELRAEWLGLPGNALRGPTHAERLRRTAVDRQVARGIGLDPFCKRPVNGLEGIASDLVQHLNLLEFEYERILDRI